MGQVVSCVLFRKGGWPQIDDPAGFAERLSKVGYFRYLHPVTREIIQRNISNVAYVEATGSIVGDLELLDGDISENGFKAVPVTCSVSTLGQRADSIVRPTDG